MKHKIHLGWLLGASFTFASLSAFQSAEAVATWLQDPPFEELDINEDGVLSGTETKGYLDRDADGDGEVTEKEYAKAKPKPKQKPRKPDPKPSDDEIGTSPGMEEFVDFLVEGDSNPLLSRFHPKLLEVIDSPILIFAQELMTQELGDAEDPVLTDLEEEELPGEIGEVNRTTGTLHFEEGDAAISISELKEKVVAIDIRTPCFKDLSQEFVRAIKKDQALSNTVRKFYTRRSRDLVEDILESRDDEAIAKLMPLLVEQVTEEKLRGIFEMIRSQANGGEFGKVTSIETTEGTEASIPTFTLTNRIDVDGKELNVLIDFAPIGLHSEISGIRMTSDSDLQDGEDGPVIPENLKDQKFYPVKFDPLQIEVIFPGTAEPTSKTLPNGEQWVGVNEQNEMRFTVGIYDMGEDAESREQAILDRYAEALVELSNGKEARFKDLEWNGQAMKEIRFVDESGAYELCRAILVGDRLVAVDVRSPELKKGGDREKLANSFLSSLKSTKSVPPPMVEPPPSFSDDK